MLYVLHPPHFLRASHPRTWTSSPRITGGRSSLYWEPRAKLQLSSCQGLLGFPNLEAYVAVKVTHETWSLTITHTWSQRTRNDVPPPATLPTLKAPRNNQLSRVFEVWLQNTTQTTNTTKWQHLWRIRKRLHANLKIFTAVESLMCFEKG